MVNLNINVDKKNRHVKRWVAASLASFALLGAVSVTPATQHTLPVSQVRASADTTNGTFGTVSYTYDNSTNTLTFTSGGTLPVSSASSLSTLFPNVQHIVFTQAVAAPQQSENLFGGLTKLTDFTGLTNLDTSNTEHMGSLFADDSSLTSVDLSKFNTANVGNFDKMFYNCSSLTSLDVSSFNTAQVTNINDMFNGLSSVKNLDLSTFNTNRLQYTERMFENTSSLQTVDLSSFTTLITSGSYQTFSQIGNGQKLFVKLAQARIDPAESTGLGDHSSSDRYGYYTLVDSPSTANPQALTMNANDYTTFFDTGAKTGGWYEWGTTVPVTQITETKTVKRTINYLDSNHNEIAGQSPLVQTVSYQRTATKNWLTGAVTDYGQWQLATDSATQFSDVQIQQELGDNYIDPKVNDKAVTEINAETPTADSSDENIDVIYSTKTPTPTPTPAPTPNTPVTPTPTPSNNGGNGSNTPANGGTTPSSSGSNTPAASHTPSSETTNGTSGKTAKGVYGSSYSVAGNAVRHAMPETGKMIEKNAGIFVPAFLVAGLSTVGYLLTKRNK
ncbi:BspA family leucine-rich repeat surface protein [Fructobacillus durionis]|uniref:Surface protein n=1 Tax=Fructobacillus durionis TaxID=283737 RepID=A0A1I1ET38_9LACO|nr:BspA family leucine-rich repeat surface protein [Fructobacillus durionis]SFB88688.1 surface protein [Fructobacillus durionis]